MELKIPPLLLVAIAALVMWLAAKLVPQLTFVLPGHMALAVSFVFAGLASSIAGIVSFRRARTTVNPMEPS